MIRKTTETRSEFQVNGYMLTEKTKASLRKLGLKTDTNTWSDVFNGIDVVYKWNPEKQKSDVFVGQIAAVKYPTGKTRSLEYLPNGIWGTLTPILEAIPVSKRPTFGAFTISADRVKRSV